MHDPAEERSPSPWRRLHVPEVKAFVAETLYAPDRERPVVAVTTSKATGRPWVDPGALAARAGERAEVVLIETGEATGALAAALPPRLEVFGGAVRIWWPGLAADAEPRDHPLLFAFNASDGESVLERVLAALGAGAGLAASRDAWRELSEECFVGDVLTGRVTRVLDRGVLVELRPGVVGHVRIGELDWSFVEHPSDIVEEGQDLDVEILSMDVLGRRADLSVKRALGRVPGSGLRAGGRADAPPAAGGRQEAPDVERDRLRARVRELERTLRSERDRAEAQRRRVQPEEDPLSSEAAFLLAVRLAYARTFGEGERHAHPLGRMRVGPEFLARLAGLQGVSLEKVIEVCMQVATDTARSLAAREVHPLHTGPAGSPARERARDGAKAWRCALQVGTASARRLHWWVVPSEHGPVHEFASVGLHDDMSIPE